jgi:hypothetical protein
MITSEHSAPTILCTHGENMTPALATIRANGVTVPALNDDQLLAKGTAWELTLDDSHHIVAFHHLDPHPMDDSTTPEPPHGQP